MNKKTAPLRSAAICAEPSSKPAFPAPEVGEANLLQFFETLVSRLPQSPEPQSADHTAAGAMLEVERDGQVYSLCCRKKTVAAPAVELSPREREIARLISIGFPNKAIAAVLEISEWTVGTHLRRVFAKLGVSCRAAMVTRWLELQPPRERHETLNTKKP